MTLQLEAIRKAFGRQVILDGISCAFPDGQISTVLGVSGSGKTTLLRIVAGLEQPDEGEVLLGGARITHATPQRRRVGFVFQDGGVYGHLTVEANLLLPLRAERLGLEEAQERIRQAARHFGLDQFLERPAGLLSGGEAQRLSLAKALIREPHIMLLDEPFTQLDASLQRGARRFVFQELHARGTTAVLVTHNHHDAQEAGGPIFFLEEGRFVQQGRWEDLYRQPATPTVARVVSFLEPVSVRGRIVGRGNGLKLRSPQLSMDLPVRRELTATWKGTDEQEAELLFRPEELTARANSTVPGAEFVGGKVVHSYRLGRDSYLRIRHASGLLLEARRSDGEDGMVPEQASVFFDPAAQVLLWCPPFGGSLGD